MTRSAVVMDGLSAPNEALEPSQPWSRAPWALQYAAALLTVALATAVALGMQRIVPVASLTLLYVLPVIVVAIAFGWGPSLCAAFAGPLAFDFFFTEPRYSLAIASPADLWSTGLLLAIGAVISAVATQSRQRTLEAQRAAARAKALQGLAHQVIMGAPRQQVLEAAAWALCEIFAAPAAVLASQNGEVELLSAAGDARLNAQDRSAAAVALDAHTPTRAGAYPTDRARFDFWPVILAGGEAFAIGVDFSATDGRPKDSQRYVEAVGGYLAAALP